MKSFRKIIRHPGQLKLHRWQTSLHEAAHMVAYIHLCGTWAAGFVFGYGGNGGVCCHGRPQGPVENSLIATAAGVAAGAHAGWLPCPGGRPRRIRGKLPSGIPSDQKQAAKFIELLNRVEAQNSVPPRSLAAVEVDAFVFVWVHLDEIIRVAERLFLTGRAYMPAPPKSKTSAVDVLPGEITHMAASAAKG